MADPLTVLGAAAAAAQLADQAFSLVIFFTDLYGKIKEAPELTQARVAHIEQLQSVSNLIKKTKPLQTNEVQVILVACLQTTIDLNGILKKYSSEKRSLLKRTLQSVKAVQKEERVIVLLDRIEKQKSLLALCIHQLDAAQLETLNIEVSEVRTALGNTAIVINDTAEHVQTLVDITPTMADQVQELFKNVPGLLGRIEEDLKAYQPYNPALTKISSPIPGRRSRLINFRFLFWSFIIFSLSVLVCYTYIDQFDRKIETSLHPYKFYEVPSQRAKNFVGRKETLARIKSGLSSPSSHMPKVVVIRAMGGQGKTQVALEYCRLWRNTSDIFWIDATSEGTVKASFALLSYVLDPSTNSALETEAQVSNVRRALADRKTPWLMVFDNYDHPQSYNIRKFLPDNKLGMVIVTSRHKDSESLADRENRIELKGLDDIEAIKLLLLESEMDRSVNISTQHATIIVHRLAYHPLAIAQAGAYISMRNLELEDFLDDYNKRQAAILKDTTPLMSDYWKKANESSQEIPMSVFTTCELSYQQLLDLENIEQRNLPDLLITLAFFDSRDISEALFKAYRRKHGQLHSVTDGYKLQGETQVSAEQRPSKPASAIPFKGPGSFLRQHEGEWDSVSFYEALLVLRRLSLAEFSRPSRKGESLHVSLHPLIRDWLRLRTPRDQCPDYSSLAATCIYKFLAGTRDWAAYQMTLSEKQQLIGHINAYAINIAEFGVGQHLEAFDIPVYDKGRHKGRPAYEFSKLLYQNGQYKSSAEWSRRSLAQRLQQFGPEASETLAAQASLAGALHSQGEYEDANKIYIHVIEVKERTLGSGHPETLLSKMNLAPLLTNQGKYEAAESIYRQVLDSYNKMLGEWDPNTIIAMGALGSLLNIIGSLKEAEELNRRALTLARIVFGPRHHRTLAIMDFLGVSLTGLDKLEEAEIILQDALRVRERVSGNEHPDTIICMNHLVPVLYWQRKYAAAWEVQVRILGAEKATSRMTTAQPTEGIYSYFASGGFRRDMVYGLYTSMDSAGVTTIRRIHDPLLGSTVDPLINLPSTTQA